MRSAIQHLHSHGPRTETDMIPLSSSWIEEWCAQFEEELQSGQRSWFRGKVADDAIRSPEYPHLFKYRAVNLENPGWTETILKDKRVWAASLDRFNDPL